MLDKIDTVRYDKITSSLHLDCYLKEHGIFTVQEAMLAFEYPERLAEMRYMELQQKYNTLLQKLRFIKDIVND
jgi:hypothetical protein